MPLGASSTEVSSAERSSLHAYTSPAHFLTINGSLRGEILHGAAPASPESDRHIANLDAVMSRSRMTEDVEVWRGMQSGADRLFGDRMGGDMTGLEWREQGFMSTSVRRSAAQEFAQSGSGSILMRVRAPEGTGAAKLAEKERDGEGEVVLERGLTMRVVADHGVDPDWGHRVLDIEVVLA